MNQIINTRQLKTSIETKPITITEVGNPDNESNDPILLNPNGVEMDYAVGVNVGEDPNCYSDGSLRTLHRSPQISIPDGKVARPSLTLCPQETICYTPNSLGLNNIRFLMIRAKQGEFLFNYNDCEAIKTKFFMIDMTDPYIEDCDIPISTPHEETINKFCLTNPFPKEGLHVPPNYLLKGIGIEITAVGN